MKHSLKAVSLWTPAFLARTVALSFQKLAPWQLWRNPIIFIVEIAALYTTFACFVQPNDASVNFTVQISIWLWITALFATFSEAIAEGRGKAQTENLKATRAQIMAKRWTGKTYETIASSQLIFGDIVLVEANDIIPSDGDVIEGIASVDESAITGESAPVIRESGGDRSAVTGGTKVLSDWIRIKITAAQGQTALDKMIAMVEGSVRQKTPNEIALTILLLAMTLIFLVVVVSIYPLALFSKKDPVDIVILVALLISLIPTTIGGLLSAIGIAGMNRLLKLNVLANSGRAVEAAGDVDVMMFDKTGTVTIGNRCAVEFIPMPGIDMTNLVDAVGLASLADETPEGRSIVQLAKERYSWTPPASMQEYESIIFTAHTRMSGIRHKTSEIRKGATDAVLHYMGEVMGEPLSPPEEFTKEVHKISASGGTPFAIMSAEGSKATLLGLIHLKDVIKPGLKMRFALLKRIGIRTVMITGDNPVTARAIAAEAGIDDVIAQATPEAKLNYIRQVQREGHLIAMCGDGSNDAPALSQADVAIAMNTGTQAAKEAGNMIDLDSDPTKIINVVAVGKQMLITRGSLTTFSIANDVAKYFAIIPALFVSMYPGLEILNIMNLCTPKSAILSAVIFNALILVGLLPLALRGVKFRPASAADILRSNLLIYGIGGIIAPFIGIKIIDMVICFLKVI
ncbi:MAG: potassium-transporting ATPase subunit KdpB [Alphaproteobacteria bacterium]|jgi:K+-transporting ATPase ATPase B chain|nr:potassium-transporting ATPase subunit KdpB [Alphaproteobacteria bacterium]